MKITFTIKDKSESFYENLAALSDVEKFAYLNKNAHGTYAMHGLSMKIGTGQFRDKVELNQIMRTTPVYAYTLGNRRGYKLATFEITQGA